MSIGSGIAVAGIWLGVAVVGFSAGEVSAVVALFAMMGTLFVSLAS